MTLETSEHFRKLLPTGLYIFVPTFIEQCFSNCLKSVARVSHLMGCLDVPVVIGTVSNPDIADVRNSALSIWYEILPQCSHMLMVDADMGFDPKLVLDMIAFNQPITGAVYPKKQLERDWVIGVSPTEDQQRLMSSCGGFVSCDGVGGGCLLIRRDAIDEMVKAYPDHYHPDLQYAPLAAHMKMAGVKKILKFFDKITLPNGKVVSEDISFCKRWQDLNLLQPADDIKAQDLTSRMNQEGHHIWAAIGHKVTHMGPYEFAGCFKDEVVTRIEKP